MNYNKIISKIAKQEKISKKEVEREMKKALILAGINCSPKEFVLKTANGVSKTIYSI